MESPFYNQYLFKYKLDTKYEEIERDLQQLGPEVHISVMDLSEKGAEECVHIIGSIVNAERIRMYEKDKQRECYVHVIRHTDGRYMSIISVYPGGESYKNLSRMFEILCHTEKISRITSGKERSLCEGYWYGYMREFSHSCRVVHKEKYDLDGDDLFPIEIDEIYELKNMFKMYPNRAKALLTCAFGRVACAYSRSDSVILEDHIGNSKLNRMPVRVCDLTSEKPINDVSDAFGQASLNDDMTFNEISGLCKVDLKNYILYDQTVIYDGMYRGFMETAIPGVIYQFDAIEYSDTPLMIVFHMDGEMASLQLIYDTMHFRHISIEGVHKAFCVTLSKLIRGDYTAVNYSSYLAKPESAESKRFELVAACLKKSGWFDSYENVDLLKLAEKCKLKRMFYGQHFIDSGTLMDSVCLLIHGKVEVEMRDRGNIAHSLRLLKELDFFGLESVTKNRKAAEDYMVATDDAVIVMIDRELFLQEAAAHSDLLVNALKVQNSLVLKYEKLWMMS